MIQARIIDCDLRQFASLELVRQQTTKLSLSPSLTLSSLCPPLSVMVSNRRRVANEMLLA